MNTPSAKNQLIEYYSELEKIYGQSNPETLADICDYVLEMPDESADLIIETYSNNEAISKRLSAYAKALTGYRPKLSFAYTIPNLHSGMVAESLPPYGSQHSEDTSDNNEIHEEIHDNLIHIINANRKYNKTSERRITIGGNHFTYQDGFPIDDYIYILTQFGQDEEGNAWDVSLTDDGELVIY